MKNKKQLSRVAIAALITSHSRSYNKNEPLRSNINIDDTVYSILMRSGIIISNGNMFPKPFNANKLCRIPITNGIAKIKLTCFAIAFSFLVL